MQTLSVEAARFIVLQPGGRAAGSLEAGAAPTQRGGRRPRPPRCAPERASVPGPRPPLRHGRRALGRRAGADRWVVSGARAGAGGFGAGQRGQHWVAKLLRARGRRSAQGRGRKGKKGSRGIPWTPPSRSCPLPGTARRLGQRGSLARPRTGWGLRGLRPPGSPVLRRHVFRAVRATSLLPARLRPTARLGSQRCHWKLD